MRVEIAAPAEAIYDLVADMTRMGEWSSECERVEWTGGATAPAVGVGLVGHNRNGATLDRLRSAAGEQARARPAPTA